MSQPLVINQPMVGASVGIMVKAIHEATLKGYVPVLSQCHNYFGTVTVTMVKDEGVKIEQSVGESGSDGNGEADNQTGSQEDRGEQTDTSGSTVGNDGNGNGDEQVEPEGGHTADNAGVVAEPSGGAGEEAPKQKVKSTRKTTQSK